MLVNFTKFAPPYVFQFIPTKHQNNINGNNSVSKIMLHIH